MAKMKNDYFNLIEAQMDYCVQASTLLSEILCNYTALSIPKQREKMHKIKHTAVEQRHDILSRLSAEFITPIDQEDILRLVQIINKITDALDKVVLGFYMFNIAETPVFVPTISKTIDKGVKTLYDVINELKNFKKPTALRNFLVDVNSVKGETDALFAEAIRDLFANEKDCKKIISHKAIYGSLKDCCDLCQHAADVIEQIIIKNT